MAYENELALIGAASNKPLTRSKRAVSNGYSVIADDPKSLAEAAGVDLDTYALARTISSEARPNSPAEMLAIGEAIRNQADDNGTGIYDLVTHHRKRADVSGRFGEQHGRYASTQNDPTARSLEVAKIVMQRTTDLAQGATHWIDPKVQDSGKQGSRTIVPTAEIVKRREKAGLMPIQIEGVDPGRLMMFAKAGLKKAGAAIADSPGYDKKGQGGSTGPDPFPPASSPKPSPLTTVPKTSVSPLLRFLAFFKEGSILRRILSKLFP